MPATQHLSVSAAQSDYTGKTARVVRDKLTSHASRKERKLSVMIEEILRSA
jgi:hypothetical protein